MKIVIHPLILGEGKVFKNEDIIKYENCIDTVKVSKE